MWLKLRSPILIYDSRARAALEGKSRTLEEYYEQWKAEFAKKKLGIQAACAALIGMEQFTINPNKAKELNVSLLAGESWFHERVFDIYLWEKGGSVPGSMAVTAGANAP